MLNKNILYKKIISDKLIGKLVTMCLLTGSISFITGCQSFQKNNPHSPFNQSHTKLKNPKHIHYSINGKIAIRYPTKNNKLKSATVFYNWQQNHKDYLIDLSGAFGAGSTQIYGNATQSFLQNNEGTKTANSPEELLFKIAKWHAPISKLPFWIVGKPTPNGINNKYDDKNRLVSSQTNANKHNWQAKLIYEEDSNLPKKLTITQQLNQSSTKTIPTKVIMIIRHNSSN